MTPAQPADLPGTAAGGPTAASAWKCGRCPETRVALRYRSGKMKDCYTCQAYANMEINAKQKARKRGFDGTERLVQFSRDEFQAWVKTNPRLCRYCGIDDHQYWTLDLRTANGVRAEALGIDRVTNEDHYSLDNIVWCCYPCNRAKGNVFTTEEMESIGKAIRTAWQGRLGLL